MRAHGSRPPARVRGAVVLVLALPLAACTDSPSVPTPGRWGDGAGGVVTLHADGTGEVAGLPHGDGPGCDPSTFALVEGDVTWEEVEPGEVHLRAGDAEVTLWADRGGFGGDISWYKVVVGPCADRTTDAEALTWTRDTRPDA